HPGRQRRRGYNQAECIARGIASVAQIPVDCRSLVRKRQTNTQTHKNVFERWTNVQDIFHVNTPQKLTGKHILLVDDVLTTGATIEACAQRINAIEGAHISILTLSIA
ncbi:MAG: phosphoribosyltransferase family protein, partial [Parabacteroides sp.]|nr:phosphoribosyltransferase family protein [Parabacteroides sp.]